MLRKFRLVAGKGGRKSDSSLPFALWPAYPYGSSTASSSNSAVPGTEMPTRMTPLVRSMLYASRFALKVDVSASGEFEPSFFRKIGSVPRVARNRSWMPRVLTVMLFAG